MNRTAVLYKKNPVFAIRRMRVRMDELDAMLASLPEGRMFGDIPLKAGESIDIIDIKYVMDGEWMQLIIHFAIIGQDA